MLDLYKLFELGAKSKRKKLSPKFIVNDPVVVCILQGKDALGNLIKVKSIAKCDETDTFSEEFGKSLALAKAEARLAKYQHTANLALVRYVKRVCDASDRERSKKTKKLTDLLDSVREKNAT